jgi:hypothetical protein
VYLAGVAAVVGDVSDLIITEIAQLLQDEEVADGLLMLGEINKKMEKFKHGEGQADHVSRFERRFAVIVGDVTMATIKPSAEVQKALDASAENTALNEVVANNLGFETGAEMKAAIKDRTIKSADVIAARKLAYVVSDNLHGMDLGERTYTLKVEGLENLDPNLVTAIGSALPAVTAAVTRGQGPRGGQPTKNPRRK